MPHLKGIWKDYHADQRFWIQDRQDHKAAVPTPELMPAK
jgi:hypothetical protein